MTDLYPKLYLLFPTPERAHNFCAAARRFLHPGVTAEQFGCRVEVDGDDVQHPTMRLDIVHAAKVMGGDEVPAPRRLN